MHDNVKWPRNKVLNTFPASVRNPARPEVYRRFLNFSPCWLCSAWTCSAPSRSQTCSRSFKATRSSPTSTLSFTPERSAGLCCRRLWSLPGGKHGHWTHEVLFLVKGLSAWARPKQSVRLRLPLRPDAAGEYGKLLNAEISMWNLCCGLWT